MNTQDVIYNDYSNFDNTDSSIASIIALLSIDICALANASGGTIIIGKDANDNIIPQPDDIKKYLAHPKIEYFVNKRTDNLIVLEVKEEDTCITITVQPALFMIKLSLEVNKSTTVYIRKDNQSKLADDSEKAKIIAEKEKQTHHENVKQLNKIVHHKVFIKDEKISKWNIFDAFWIILEEEIRRFPTTTYLIDYIAIDSILFGVHMQHTKYFIIEDFFRLQAALSKDRQVNDTYLHDYISKNKTTQENIINGFREKIINSKACADYIAEYTFN